MRSRLLALDRNLGGTCARRRSRFDTPLALLRVPVARRSGAMGPKKPAKKKKKSGGGVKISSQTPIFGSIEDGDRDEFDECLAQTPQCVRETNKNGWTPMLEALIAAGAGIDERDHDGDTPVHYAAVQGELECVEALARAGAKLDLKDNDGETPAHVAHKSVKKRLKELLEEAKAKKGEASEAKGEASEAKAEGEASADADAAAEAVAKVELGGE
jgi:hypothetical protein